MDQQLANFFEKIKFLPGNNRSLLLLDLPPGYFLDLKSLENTNGPSSFNIINAIISREKVIQISESSHNKDLHDQLLKIHRNEKLIFEERGGKDLYIGWPFVRGKLNDGTLIRCPFIFFPFSLRLVDNHWFLEKREDVNITLNKTFLLRYAYHNQVSLSEDIIEMVLNDFNTDSTLFRSELYAMLKDSELDIEFNQRNFIDELKPFQTFQQKELEKNEVSGKLRLYPYATLGIFPQAGAYLISDYDRLLKTQDQKGLKNILNSKIDVDEKKPSTIPERDIYAPLNMDGYQEEAIRNIKAGNSIAVHGPPGTGKSQLISNLMSDYIAHGKSVLLVSQKVNALDTVFNRLQSLELGNFIGLVHDFKNERKNIYEQITRQIESLNDYKQKNASLDIDHLERRFIQTSNAIEEIITTLDDFKYALFDNSECGKSIRELYLLAGKDDPSLQLNQIYRNFTFNKIEKFLPALETYMDHHRRFESGEHFWTKGPSLSKVRKVDSDQFSQILDEVYAFEEHLKSESKKFTKNEIDFETALFFLSNIDSLQQLAENLKNETTYSFYIHMVDNTPNKDIGWLSQMERNLLQCFKGAGPEISLPSSDLGRFQEALEHAINARKGIFSWFRWKLFSEDKIFITRILVANDLKSNKVGFETLLERIDNRLNIEHLISEIRHEKWLKDFPDNFRKIDIQNWFFYQKLAFKSYQLRDIVRSLPNYILAKNETLKDYVSTIHQLIVLVNKIPEKLKKWSKYISEAQVRYLLLGKTERSKVEKQIQEDLNDILAYHALRDAFETEELKMIDDLTAMELEGKGEVETLFMSSICNAWIDHIEQKFPILNIASSQQIEKHSEDLQSEIEEKLRITKDLLKFKAREKAISSTENEGVETSYEELYELLKDTKKNWPIRRVISQHEEEIFSLLPVWITTPETASAIFPMKEIFDVVIFDESNSCLVERGLPALFRGRCWMVVGDDKQLSPSNIYDEELESNNVSNSVFHLVKDQLFTVSLKRHYNVEDLSLLSFANKYFYNGELLYIPRYSLDSTHGIRSLQVAGNWTTKGNRKEASEVVKIVTDWLKQEPEKRLGVIVMNSIQGALILDLLNENQIQLPDSFSIKTVQNIQGNMFDHIIFSTTYDQWDSFNHSQVETINVISTRAKISMTIVSSLSDFEVNKSDPEHISMLKSFISYGINKGLTPSEDKVSVSSDNIKFLKSYLIAKSLNKKMLANDLSFADVAIKKDGKYKGIVVTDDLLNLESSRDAFCNKYNLYRERKWPFIQFYSREFWENQTLAFDKLDRFIARET